MKRLMSVMLGLSLLAGTTAMFAADKDTTSKSTAAGKKKGKKKKATTEAPAPKKS